MLRGFALATRAVFDLLIVMFVIMAMFAIYCHESFGVAPYHVPAFGPIPLPLSRFSAFWRAKAGII
jgi:hypothetical protein